MANSSKPMSSNDMEQTLKFAFNEEEKSISVGSFITGKVGHKIEVAVVSPTVDDFQYYDGATLLQTIRVTYTDNTKANFVSAERVN